MTIAADPSTHPIVKSEDANVELNVGLKRRFDELFAGFSLVKNKEQIAYWFNEVNSDKGKLIVKNAHVSDVKSKLNSYGGDGKDEYEGEDSDIYADCDDDDDDDDEDSLSNEEEDKLVKQMVTAAFSSKSHSCVNFSNSFEAAQSAKLTTEGREEQQAKRAKVSEQPSEQRQDGFSSLSPGNIRGRRGSLLSTSAPCFRMLASKAEGAVSESSTLLADSTTYSHSALQPPDEFLQQLMKRSGFQTRAVPHNDCSTFFYQYTLKDRADYDMEVVQAVRAGDVVKLRKLHKQGRSMQCVNLFGDSIVHIACRRSAVDVLTFLLEEANVNVRLCCENGRNPLHDACWTGDANLTIARKLIAACPDLLYIADKRGHTPLKFVRQSNWAEWINFLKQLQPTTLAPKELVM